MGRWRKLTEYRSICWLVITAIFLITLMPAHYHLHHLVQAGSAIHEHTTDLHFVMNKADQSHHDENTYSFSAVPDGITKKVSSIFILFAALTALLIILPLLKLRTKYKLNYDAIDLKKRFSTPTPLFAHHLKPLQHI